MTNGAEKLKPCPFCGTAMRDHGHCFSHPRPSGPDCIIRHYSFDKQKAEQWNTRTPAPSSDIEELVAWLNEVRTGRHGDITLHSGMAGIRLKQAADTLLAIQGERDALRAIVTKCADKFDHYEQLHRLKCTSEGDEKADRNRELADMCRAALTATKNGARPVASRGG
jgi:hypothetical protein